MIQNPNLWAFETSLIYEINSLRVGLSIRRKDFRFDPGRGGFSFFRTVCAVVNLFLKNMLILLADLYLLSSYFLLDTQNYLHLHSEDITTGGCLYFPDLKHIPTNASAIDILLFH